jgi:ketosteroid isomerase-like protein
VASGNVDLVRSICTAWSRGDFSSAEWAHPDIEFSPPPEVPDEGAVRGLDAMGRNFRSWLSTTEGFRVDPEEFVEVGDQVIVLFRGHGSARRSRIPYEGASFAGVFELREDKVVRLTIHFSKEAAFKAAGLE